jgi:hypothetical protein
MLVMRNRPKGARSASFGLGLCIFALIPTEVGYQDIASLLARQPGVAERWQKRVVASAVSSIQVATFSFGRPIGTSSRNPTLQLASFDSSDSDITGALTRNPFAQAPRRYEAADFPKVDRTLKGDRLATRSPDTTPRCRWKPSHSTIPRPRPKPRSSRSSPRRRRMAFRSRPRACSSAARRLARPVRPWSAGSPAKSRPS